MSEQLEHPWVTEIFTPDELKQYAAFEAEWKNNASLEQKATFEKNWASLVADIINNLETDPNSATGIEIGKRCMQLINGIYGKKYAHLRTKKFEEGFAKGKGLNSVGLTPETVSWMDKAIDAYWKDRIYKILNKVGTGVADETIFTLWKEVLEDMCGEDDKRKKMIFDAALSDDNINNKAKEWLKTLRDLAVINQHLQ